MRAAEKARDSLAKGLYNELFCRIIQHINNYHATYASVYSVGIMDIAGFGRFIFELKTVTITLRKEL